MNDAPDAPLAVRPVGRLALTQIPRTLVGPRWRWATLIVILGVVVLARLGIWQLDRLDQRRAHNAALARQLAAAPLALTAEELPAAPEALADRTAQVRGRFDLAHQLVLALQTWQGRPGVHLLTPLIIEGSDKAVLVDRGWIPDEEYRANNLRAYDPARDQGITGVIALSSPGPTALPADDNRERAWYRVDLGAMAAALPYELLPVYLRQLPDAAGGLELPYKAPREVDLSEGPHLSYAIQWFAFAALLAIGYVYFVLVQFRRLGPD